jgi:hypothetical protein
MIRKNSSPVRPHNDYLWIAAEYGLFGLAFYLCFLATIFIGLYRQSFLPSQILQTSFFAISIFAILGHSFFSFSKEQTQAALLLYVLCGLVSHGLPKVTISRKWGLCLAVLFILQASGAAALCTSHIWFDHQYVKALLAEGNDDWHSVESSTRSGLSHGAFRSHMWIIEGRSEEHQQRYATAEEAYLQALALSPYNWHAHNGLGIVHKRHENYDLALWHYLEALRYFPGQNNPNSLGIRTNLGALYKAMRKLQEAESEYRNILAADAENAGANNNMANFYKHRGQLDSARVAYQTALRTDST